MEAVLQQEGDGTVVAGHSNGAAGGRPACNGTHAEGDNGRDKCLAHHKNDSGSYDTSPNDLLASSGVPGECSVALTNGEASSLPPSVSEGRDTHPRATSSASLHSGTGSSHHRATSSASLHSEGRGQSSTSSSSLELSHASSSFNSKDLLEQLVSDLSASSLDGEAIAKNEVVKQLLEHIISLKLELEELKGENVKLCEVRTTMDDELHTLTENLFEEAYKMVDTAKEEKGLAVKKLADAAGKIDAMETEMSALKNLLHTPNASHPVLTLTKTPSPHSKHRKPNVRKVLRKLSRKVKVSTSKTALKGGAGPGDSLAPPTHALLVEHKSTVKGACLEEGELDPNEFGVFREWLSDLSQHDHPYLLRVSRDDIQPCLSFHNTQLSIEVQAAVRNNQLLMESLSPCTAEEKRVCMMSGCEEICCTHRMQLGPSQQWLYISQHCRDRIAAVCDFYMYISHIEKGILKQDATQLFWQVNRLRAGMNLARLNLQFPD